MDFLNKMKRPFTTLARGKIKIMLMEGWGRLGVRPNHVICIKVMANNISCGCLNCLPFFPFIRL